MQIDAAVAWALAAEAALGELLMALGRQAGLIPLRGCTASAELKDPRWDAACRDPVLLGDRSGPSPRGYEKLPTAEADRGRHAGFLGFNVYTGGPGSLAERSAT